MNYQTSHGASIFSRNKKKSGQSQTRPQETSLNDVSVLPASMIHQPSKKSEISKFSKQSGSQKQYGGASSIYQNMGTLVDINYYKNKLNALEKREKMKN